MDCTGCKHKKACGLDYSEYDVECPEYEKKEPKNPKLPPMIP